MAEEVLAEKVEKSVQDGFVQENFPVDYLHSSEKYGKIYTTAEKTGKIKNAITNPETK